jgi:hypothetical protein
LSPQSRPCCPKKTGMRQHSSGTVGGVVANRAVGTNEKSTVTTSDPALCGLSAIIALMTPKKSQCDIGANQWRKSHAEDSITYHEYAWCDQCVGHFSECIEN